MLGQRLPSKTATAKQKARQLYMQSKKLTQTPTNLMQLLLGQFL